MTSLPAWGSESPNAARVRPSAMPGRYRSFCSSVPAIRTGPVGRRVNSNIRAALLEYLATSSMAIAKPRIPAPAPPYSLGMHRPSSPASRNAAKRSSGYVPSRSISRALGLTLSWASLRTDCCRAAISSERSKSTREGYRTSPQGNFVILRPDETDSTDSEDSADSTDSQATADSTDSAESTDSQATADSTDSTDSPPSAESSDSAPSSASPVSPGPTDSTVSTGSVASVASAASTDTPASRADLQTKLRKQAKKEKRHRHRWRRRIIYGLSAIVLLALVSAGGLYYYVNYRYDQIKKIHAPHLVKAAAAPDAPFNILLVGSDSRAFVGDNSSLANEVGSSANAGGQRSDVTMVARFVPATKSVTVLSIPRDLWVDIPGDVSGVSGMNRINAAYDSGPDLLIQTIEQVLNIPINYYASVNFPGFSSMVDALGGVDMSFPTAIKDDYTGLNVSTLGCQAINGTTSLQLVRSRHLYYQDTSGDWVSDGQSDFSRIQRQDAFFRAVLAKVNESDTNPLAINGFISAAVGNLTISDTLTKSDLFHIAEEFRGLQSSHLVTETLPTTEFVTDGGADVLLAAQPYATQQITDFNAIGLHFPIGGVTTTTAPPLANNVVSVDVLNASGSGDLAGQTASGLKSDGFNVTNIDNAPSVIASGNPSEIFYGPNGLPAAHTLAASLNGNVSYVADPTLSANDVTLWVASSQLTVSTTTTTTSTTAPPPGTPTTTTTIPGNVVTNTQSEPWNPTPCNLGAPTTTTTTTTVASAKSKAKAKG